MPRLQIEPLDLGPRRVIRKIRHLDGIRVRLIEQLLRNLQIRIHQKRRIQFKKRSPVQRRFAKNN